VTDMASVSNNPSKREFLQGAWPAVAVLLMTFVISTLITEFTFVGGAKALWVVSLRFFYLSVILLLPIFLLPRLCILLQNLGNRGKWRLVQIPADRDPRVAPLKNWVFRPLQGIGLMMLMATKLLAVLYAGSAVTASTLHPPMQFQAERFLSVTSIAFLASALLSLLWTVDDLGIRFHDRKTGEVKMIGKYLGFLLPVFFGFYGIMSLIDTHSQILAARYIAQMVIILYPPFVFLNVFHARYIRQHEPLLLGCLKASPLVIIVDGDSPEPGKPS
jgi:hypothetical protein